jgi:hypothetical protein
MVDEKFVPIVREASALTDHFYQRPLCWRDRINFEVHIHQNYMFGQLSTTGTTRNWKTSQNRISAKCAHPGIQEISSNTGSSRLSLPLRGATSQSMNQTAQTQTIRPSTSLPLWFRQLWSNRQVILVLVVTSLLYLKHPSQAPPPPLP